MTLCDGCIDGRGGAFFKGGVSFSFHSAGVMLLYTQVVKKLQALFGDLYNEDNVILSGIHTHSGPAGFFQYVLFEVTSLGYVKETLEVTVDGIVKSISNGEFTGHTCAY